MSWNPERIELLKKRWQQGASCSEIANELGHGFTRNSISGKIHRLGLSGRATVHTARPAPKPKMTTRRATQQLASLAAASISSSSAPTLNPPPPQARIENTACVSLLGLKPRQCRYPNGDQAPFMFCGVATLSEDVSYCPHHYLLCHVAPSTRAMRGLQTVLEDAGEA